jgi:hypothetical protein
LTLFLVPYVRPRAYYGATNFFGGPTSSVNRERLELLEKQNEDASFVILSDLHLDNVEVSESD